jgi:hypothetical protein
VASALELAARLRDLLPPSPYDPGRGWGTFPRVMAFQPGIYKTTKFLPGHEATIAPNMLVLIRTDGEFAPASVLLPVANQHNTWRFQMPGVKVPATSFGWEDSLVKLPFEGFYRMKKEFTFGEGGRWVPNAIVQLGYTRAGEPILFIAQRRSPLVSNDLWFSDKGVKMELDGLLDWIEPLSWYQEPEVKPKQGAGA